MGLSDFPPILGKVQVPPGGGGGQLCWVGGWVGGLYGVAYLLRATAQKDSFIPGAFLGTLFLRCTIWGIVGARGTLYPL